MRSTFCFSLISGFLGLDLGFDVVFDGTCGAAYRGFFVDVDLVLFLYEVEEEDEFDAASRRRAGTVVHVGRNDMRVSWPIHLCFLRCSSDMKVSGASRREIDHDSHMALGVFVVREEGVVVPLEQNMHLMHIGRFLRKVPRNLILDELHEGAAAREPSSFLNSAAVKP